MIPYMKKSQIKPLQLQSHYIPNLPIDSMHTSRTGPTININTAITSSETNRINIPTNLFNQTIQFNGINRQSQEKPPHLIPMNNSQIISIPPNSQLKHSYFSFKEYSHKLEAQNQSNNIVPSFAHTIVNFKK